MWVSIKKKMRLKGLAGIHVETQGHNQKLIPKWASHNIFKFSNIFSIFFSSSFYFFPNRLPILVFQVVSLPTQRGPGYALIYDVTYLLVIIIESTFGTAKYAEAIHSFPHDSLVESTCIHLNIFCQLFVLICILKYISTLYVTELSRIM